MNSHIRYLPVLDMDGCTFNSLYMRLLVGIINQFWDFIYEYGNKEWGEVDSSTVNKKAAEILEAIDTFDLSHTHYKDMPSWITHPQFVRYVLLLLNNEKKYNAQASVHTVTPIIMLECQGYLARMNSEILLKKDLRL